MSDSKKPNNFKTALILLSIALLFFLGIFAKRVWLEQFGVSNLLRKRRARRQRSSEGRSQRERGATFTEILTGDLQRKLPINRGQIGPLAIRKRLPWQLRG